MISKKEHLLVKPHLKVQLFLAESISEVQNRNKRGESFPFHGLNLVKDSTNVCNKIIVNPRDSPTRTYFFEKDEPLWQL